jgi:hypothetical protein
MFAIRQRLPSKQEARSLFFACAFTVNAWSIYNLLRWMPSMLPRLRIPQTVIIVSYTQAFALLESLVVFLAIISAGVILPKGALRDHWVAKGSSFLFISTAWAILYHNFPAFVPVWSRLGQIIDSIIATAVGGQTTFFGFTIFVIAYISLYVILLLGVFIRIQQKPTFADGLQTLVDRMLVLALAYILIDLLGVFIVFFHLVTL